ncbi:MAG: hypothetical protein INR65_18665 [Gluconacetobacter diazotrophicus]|nr:hypothetical protein [Gluconacetobacter diazotrophicus]
MGLDRWRRVAALGDGAAVLCAALLTVRCFLKEHARFSPGERPSLELLRAGHQPYPGNTLWWSWWDQGRYGKAAIAWAHGWTSPDWHWYLPGYPLMGAPFVGVTPADPFLIPDLACLLAVLGICVGLGRRLLDAGRWSVPLGCAAFVLAVDLWTPEMRDWVIPWTTTPEAVGFLGAVLAVAGLPGAGRRVRLRAALAGVGVGVVAGCRPADGAVILLAVCGGVLLLLPRRRWLGTAVAVALGAAGPLALVGVAYWLVWGFQPSLYLVISKGIGFEPRQLLLRWVTLVIDPGVVYPRGRGIAEGFPWLAPGLAGMASAIVMPGRAGRRVHLLVAGAAMADLLLFVCYRDLHPDGPWFYNLHHYFKTALIVSALYAARFAVLALRAARGTASRRQQGAALAGIMAVLLLVPWHVELVPWQRLSWGDGNSVVLPDGLQPIESVVMVPGNAMGAWPPSEEGHGEVENGRDEHVGVDLSLPNPGNTLAELPVLPLRRLPKQRTVIRFTSPVVLDRSREPVLYKQAIRWGMPDGWWCRMGPPRY